MVKSWDSALGTRLEVEIKWALGPLFLNPKIYTVCTQRNCLYQAALLSIETYVSTDSYGHDKQHYSKFSKIKNFSYLPKRPRQTVQTQIRLLLKKQSDQGLPCLLL